MTRPPNDRGQGRKPATGQLVQVQIRVISDDEAAAISELSPRQRAQAMLVSSASAIERTGRHRTIRLLDPLPCSILTETSTCQKTAYVAYADEVNVKGQWSLPGQWLLQPVCEECAKKAAEAYK